MNIIVSNSGKQHTPELLKSLTRKGFHVKLFTLFSSDRHKFLIQLLPRQIQRIFKKRFFSTPDNFQIIDYPFLFFLFIIFRKKTDKVEFLSNLLFDSYVAKALRRIDYDILITYENCNLLSLKEAKKSGKVTVLDLAQIHHIDILACMRAFGTQEQVAYEKDKVNPKKKEALQYTDYVFCLSDYAKDSLVQNGFCENRIFKINLGVDTDHFAAKTDYACNPRLELLFVGTVMHRKGISQIVELFHEMKELDIKWVVVGPPGDAIAILPRNESKFLYHPFIHHDELVEKYHQADVFVFPSFLDSWAQTVMEAMACGTPAIVTENTGAKEAVEKGGGLIIPVGSREALKEAILFFYNNRPVIAKMGRDARKIAETYTWDRYAKQVTDSILAICKQEKLYIN